MTAIDMLKQNIVTLQSRFHVRKIGVFGSFVRGQEHPKSDVDVLVEFEENFETFDNYAELKFFLEDLFGREVDLVLEDTLKPRLRDYILKEVAYA